MGVPSGSFVADGISDWLGEMPVERGSRSKGSFCESEFEASSAGGRPQAQRKLSVSRMTMTMAIRCMGPAMFAPIMFVPNQHTNSRAAAKGCPAQAPLRRGRALSRITVDAPGVHPPSVCALGECSEDIVGEHQLRVG